jgi:hypothetical protein
MPRVQGDGKRLYISRKQMRPRLLSESEWTEVFEQSQVFPTRSPIPENLRNDLNGAVDAYTKYGPDSLKTLSVGELVAKVNAWLNRTDSLSKELSKTPSGANLEQAAPGGHLTVQTLRRSDGSPNVVDATLQGIDGQCA